MGGIIIERYLQDLKLVVFAEKKKVASGKFSAYKIKLKKVSKKYNKSYEEVFFDYLNLWFWT